MATVNLSDELVESAKIHARAFSRSVPKQIEFWAKVGKAADENPDLPYEFIKDIFLALEDPEPPTPFKFEELDTPEGVDE